VLFPSLYKIAKVTKYMHIKVAVTDFNHLSMAHMSAVIHNAHVHNNQVLR